MQELIDAVKPHFSTVRRYSPDASRNSSSEVYLVCRNHMPWKSPKQSIRERYEEAVDVLVGGNEIEEGPEPTKTSFTVRRRKKE